MLKTISVLSFEFRVLRWVIGAWFDCHRGRDGGTVSDPISDSDPELEYLEDYVLRSALECLDPVDPVVHIRGRIDGELILRDLDLIRPIHLSGHDVIDVLDEGLLVHLPIGALADEVPDALECADAHGARLHDGIVI